MLEVLDQGNTFGALLRRTNLKMLDVTNQKMMGMKFYPLIKVIACIYNNTATFTLTHFILR